MANGAIILLNFLKTEKGKEDRSMRRTTLVLLSLTLAIFLGAATAYGQNDGTFFAPTFIGVKFAVSQETFVADEMVTLEGIVAFDQAMTIHWDDLTPERLDL